MYTNQSTLVDHHLNISFAGSSLARVGVEGKEEAAKMTTHSNHIPCGTLPWEEYLPTISNKVGGGMPSPQK